MAKTSILTILISLAKTGNADKETIKGLAQLKASTTMAMGAFAAFAGAALAVQQALSKTVGVFVDYAMQVKELSRLTGVSAEETSKLIQAADDAAISYESLQKALWFAAKNGVDVNIDSLARLADEYQSFSSATEKAEFLAKKFGKGGAEMGKLMEHGAAGVRQMTDAIQSNLVLSEAQVQQAEETRLALDELSDTIQGLKVTAGSDIAGPLTKGLQSLNDQIEQEGLLGIGLADVLQALWASTSGGVQVVDSATNSYTAWAFAMRDTNIAMEENAAVSDAMNQRNTDMLSLIMQLQSENDSYIESLAGLHEKFIALRTEQDQYTAGSEKYNELQSEINETAGDIGELADAHEMAGKRIAFSLLQQKLAVDGLSDSEFEQLLSIGKAWGILDETTVQAASAMSASVSEIADSTDQSRHAVNLLHKQMEKLLLLSGSVMDFFVNIHVSGRIPRISAAMGDIGLGGDSPVNVTPDETIFSPGQFASGGQLGRGWAMVGEQGYEIVSPSGFVFPHDIASQMVAAGLLPGVALAVGGLMQWSEPAEPVIQSGLHSSLTSGSPRVGSRARTSTSGGISPVDSQASATAIVTEAVQPLADSTTQAVQNAQVTQQVTVTALNELTAAQSETNNLMAGIRDDLQRNNATIRASILAGVEQMRG